MAPKKPTTQVLDSYQVLVSAFCEFLTVAVHTILYERDIYPRASFLNARKYNCPVRQNRHPQVCKWIQDAVAAVEVEMLKVWSSPVAMLYQSTVVAYLLILLVVVGERSQRTLYLPSQSIQRFESIVIH